MGRVKINPLEAGTKLLARDRYSSIKHKSFLFDFMEYMSEDGWNLDTKEAQKIYEYFDGAIQRTLENGELELFERDEQPEEPVPAPEPDDPDDGTDDKPQEDPTPDHPEEEPGQGQPIPPDEMDRPNPVDNILTAINYSNSRFKPRSAALVERGPYKGYVSGSNVEPEDVLWIEEGEEILPLPNGARHFKKWSAEAKKKQSVPNFNIQMDEVKKAVEKIKKTIDFFMRDFDLSESEAETVYYYLTEKDANSKGKPPINENVKDVLDHIKALTDIVNDL